MTQSIIRPISRERKNSNSGRHLKWNLKKGRQQTTIDQYTPRAQRSFLTSDVHGSHLQLVLTRRLLETSTASPPGNSLALHFFHVIPVAYRPFCTLHSCQVSCQGELVYSRSCWQLSPRACCRAVNLAKLSYIYFFFPQSFLEISILENSVFPHKVLAANLSSYLILCSAAIWENIPGTTVHL